MRRWALSLMAAIGLVLLGALPAAAEEPVTLGSGYVVDDAGVLSTSETDAAEARLDRLREESGLDLWVVFVDTFSSPADAADWANLTAERNGLGPTQYLLAVAVESRQYYLSGDSAGPIDESRLGTIEQQRIQPALRDSDWVGAIDGAAEGLQSAATGGSGAPASGSSGGGAGTIVAVVAVVLIVGVVVFFVVRARRRGAGVTGDPAREPLDALAQRAAAALVQTDDALRSSQEELGFASAQFGDAATADLRAALTQAQQDLDQAFRIRQQLDDDVPDTDEQKRAWHAQVLELCRAAQERLSQQVAAFDELRRVEKDAPAALDRLRGERDRAASAVEAAAATADRLAGTYATAALAPVSDNVSQARERLSFADAQLTAAQAALDAGDTGAAAVALRAGEQGIAQATQLATAIDTLGARLADAGGQLPALTAEVQRDVAAAGALPDPDGLVAQAVAAAGAAVAAADPGDPLRSLETLQAADEQLDRVLGAARDAAARASRARALLPATLAQASAGVATAQDFIASRRGAVGATARTRLTEAQAALSEAQALAGTDPETAVTTAQRAEQLARQSLSSAQGDVGAFGTSAPRGGGPDMGAMLGGIVLGSMLSGGSGRPGPRIGGAPGRMGGSRSRAGGGGFGGGSRSRRGGGRF